MEYKGYKLSFPNGVHFGNNALENSEYTFSADTLFSALCQEAVKYGNDYLEKLYDLCKNGDILLSDGFPFINDNYYIPKPTIRIEFDNKKDYKAKKAFKNLKYIPVDKLDDFLNGRLDTSAEKEYFNENFGRSFIKTSIIKDDEETTPYRIGIYQYHKQSGLYIIVGYNSIDNLYFIEELLDSLSLAGIGGRRSTGLGRFELKPIKDVNSVFANRLNKKGSSHMTLSISLPKEDEIEDALLGSKYVLVKRSGFVSSNSYADTNMRKNDMYLLKSGAFIKNTYVGDVYDVSDGGNHPVYKYGKPMFMEVSV